MFSKLVPLSKESHKSLKVLPIKDFSFANKSHLLGLMASEFPMASAEYPVVFVEAEDGEFKPVAMLGVKPGENLLLSDEGKWSARYIPAILRRYPFALASGPNNDEFAVCIDEGSSVLSESEGESLFDDSGEPTKLLESAKNYLLELRKMELQTNAFCQLLKEHNLLAPLNLKIKEGEEVKSITGCFAINNERFEKLSDEIFLTFRKRGYLPIVYAHLSSLRNIENLLKVRANNIGNSNQDENVH